MKARVLTLAVVSLLATTVSAQTGYNVDIGSGAPSNSFGAAAGQTGVWNAVDADGDPHSIVNTSGTDQGVTLTGAGGWPVISYTTGSITGDNASFLADFHDSDGTAAPALWSFSGLQPGQYQVFTYAIAPDGASFQTTVNVLESSGGPQTVGGTFSGSYVAGVTHCVHLATVGSNEQLNILVTTGSQFATINGIQIVQITGNPNNPPLQATAPSPSNSAASVAVTTQVCWSNGGGATSYDVYFGTDSTPDATELQGNQAGTCWDPPGSLATNTTYYWRIDSKNSAGTTAGPTWSFTTAASAPTPPAQATSPTPSNGASNVAVSTQVCWSNGGNATSYDVYFGTDSTPDGGEFQGNQATACWDPPGNLAYSTTYYWRIDAKNAAGTTTGLTWSFTTGSQPVSPPSQAASPSPSNNATLVALASQICWSNGGGATSYDVYFGTDSTPDASEFKGNQSSTCWDPPGNLIASTTYYWRIDAKNSGGTTVGAVWSFNTVPASVSIAGNITFNGSPMAGVTINASNGGGSASTDGAGNYTLASVPYNWSGVVTPNLSGYSFTPTLISFTSVTSNQTNQNFTAEEGDSVITFTGENAGDQMGGLVTSLGDVDGDSIPDFAISAPLADGDLPDCGKVFMYSGATLDLFGTLSGVSEGDRFGHSIASGDVNGDGYSDVLIGAPYCDASGKVDAGRAYAYTFNHGEWQLLKIRSGSKTGDRFGFAVAIADVNDDHYGDLIIGAPYNDTEATNAGTVYIYSGLVFNTIRKLYGQKKSDLFGYSLARVEKVNSDSKEDFIVGAPMNDDNGSNAGKVYVYSGDDMSEDSSPSPIRTHKGANPADQFGRVVACVGRLDSDGRYEYAVGAPYYDTSEGDDAGRVYVYSGTDGDLFWAKNGADPGDLAGWSIHGGYDIDNDGQADVVMGPPRDDALAEDGGAAVCRTGTTGVALSTPFQGSNAGDWFGFSVAMIPDLDGDQLAEMLIGAPRNDDAGQEAGAAYLYLSSTTAIASATGPEDGVTDEEEQLKSDASPSTGDTANQLSFGNGCPADVAGNGSGGDGVVDALDLQAVVNALGTAQATFDLNFDGVIDDQDIAIVIASTGLCEE